jgi:hypothetical protein
MCHVGEIVPGFRKKISVPGYRLERGGQGFELGDGSLLIALFSACVLNLKVYFNIDTI